MILHLSVSESSFGRPGLALIRSGVLFLLILPIVAELRLSCVETFLTDRPFSNNFTASFSFVLVIAFMVLFKSLKRVKRVKRAIKSIVKQSQNCLNVKLYIYSFYFINKHVK